MSDFWTLVRDLTQEHPVTVHRDDGVAIVKEPGLLQLLREAIFTGNSRSGGGRNLARLPLDAGAVDLHDLIERQAWEAWRQAGGEVPGLVQPEQVIAQWAAKVTDNDTFEVTDREGDLVKVRAVDLLALWVSAIRDYFDPPKRTPNPSACLACGAKRFYHQKDGETVSETALVFLWNTGETEARELRCQVCGTSWPRSRFAWLAEALRENDAQT